MLVVVMVGGAVQSILNTPKTAYATCNPSDVTVGFTCDYKKAVSITATPPVEPGRELQEEFENEYEEVIYKVFGEDYEIMYAIAQAENGGNLRSDAVNSTEVEHSVGLFQINIAKKYGQGKRVHWDKIPGDTLEEKEEWLKDPENNAVIARVIRASSGLNAWSVYKNERYKIYLR